MSAHHTENIQRQSSMKTYIQLAVAIQLGRCYKRSLLSLMLLRSDHRRWNEEMVGILWLINVYVLIDLIVFLLQFAGLDEIDILSFTKCPRQTFLVTEFHWHSTIWFVFVYFPALAVEQNILLLNFLSQEWMVHWFYFFYFLGLYPWFVVIFMRFSFGFQLKIHLFIHSVPAWSLSSTSIAPEQRWKAKMCNIDKIVWNFVWPEIVHCILNIQSKVIQLDRKDYGSQYNEKGVQTSLHSLFVHIHGLFCSISIQ